MKTPEENELVHVLSVVDDAGELLDLLVIRHFDLIRFREQFAVPDEDPQMLDRYAVGPDDVSFIQAKLGCEVCFEFDKYGYFIEAARRE